ncbi:hypothetical protein MFRU_001g01380 [Monilinia fructicola]|nr:hypothetical protein MFRU_001g01380 [Monilinia fructicola]
MRRKLCQHAVTPGRLRCRLLISVLLTFGSSSLPTRNGRLTCSQDHQYTASAIHDQRPLSGATACSEAWLCGVLVRACSLEDPIAAIQSKSQSQLTQSVHRPMLQRREV